MELVIAEKPSVARDLARVLGVRPGKSEGRAWFENEHYAITWCIGHLVELDEPAAYDAAWKPWRLDRLPMLPAEFRLRPAAHATRQLRTVVELLRDRRFTTVINACDAGREGELIFRYVYQHARSRLPIRRLWISSLTDEAIRRGFSALRPGGDYEQLADAARSRSEADWLVGMNATRALTVHSRASGSDTLFSIGRVQTPTLALLVAREHELRKFVARPYWEVRGDFRTGDGAKFHALWRDGRVSRIGTATLAEQIVVRDRVHGEPRDPGLFPIGPRVVKLRARTVREPPPQLFDLTSLQRTANRRFGFSAARALELAQQLYEHKLVTYPRTDSRHLSSDVARELPPLFAALAALPEYAAFASQLVDRPPRPSARIVDDGKVHDHHAIIPTGTAPRGSLDRDEARVFDLIVRRFLGAFFPDAELAVTEAWIRVGAGDHEAPELGPGDREKLVEVLPAPPDHFFARGRVRIVAGWQEVAGIDATAAARTSDGAGRGAAHSRDRDRDDDEPATSTLPKLVVGQRLAGAFSPVARETTPPPRYTEATLLAAMEAAGKSIDDEALRAAMKDVGLGTPATRAAIIETLLRRRYIERDRQQLVPTVTGIGLIGTLTASTAASLASAELTGAWEARLARIARGEDTRAAFMADIARYVVEIIAAIRGSTAPASAPGLPPNGGPDRGGPPTNNASLDSGGRGGPNRSGRGGSPTNNASLDSGGRGGPNSDGRGGPAANNASLDSDGRGGPAANNVSLKRKRTRARDRGTDRVHHSPVASTARAQVASTARAQAASTARAPVASTARAQAASTARAPVASAGRAQAASTARAPVASTARAPVPSTASRATRTTSSIAAEALSCPRCKRGRLITGSRGWGCERWRDGCGFVVWFETAGRRLTSAQLRALISRGKTRKAKFLDGSGKEIHGHLVLDPSRVGGAYVVPSSS